MQSIDSRGLAVTAASRSALEHCEAAIHAFAGYAGDPLARLDQALAEDPDFILAHLVRAGILATTTEKGAEPLLCASLEAAEAQRSHANERERAHMAALRAWLQGDFERSVALYGQLLLDYPRDLFALQVAHVGDFLLGQSQLLRDRIARVRPEWDESVPGFGFVLGMHAFGLEEMGDYARAEATGKRAVELNPRDVWAIHAVAHVMEMQGRLADGTEWLGTRTRDWAPDNLFAFHNWWHLALYHYEMGDYARAVALYDDCIRPKPSAVALEMVDASALLWRLRLRQVDLGSRWSALADAWEPLIEDGYYAFNDVHAMMALLADNRLRAADKLLRRLERRTQDSDTNARMTREVGLPLSRALHAFETGRHALAVELLMPLRIVAHRFGGSHAQRDLISLTLIESALRAGQHRLARALVAERADLKPHAPLTGMLTRLACQASERAQSTPTMELVSRARQAGSIAVSA